MILLKGLHRNKKMKDTKYPSICIPRTFCNIDSKSFKKYFENVIGDNCIERVDLVTRKNYRGETYNTVFIHINEWPDNCQSQEIRSRLLEGMEVKIVYDEPWFLKCYASRLEKPERNKYNKIVVLK